MLRLNASIIIIMKQTLVVLFFFHLSLSLSLLLLSSPHLIYYRNFNRLLLLLLLLLFEKECLPQMVSTWRELTWSCASCIWKRNVQRLHWSNVKYSTLKSINDNLSGIWKWRPRSRRRLATVSERTCCNYGHLFVSFFGNICVILLSKRNDNEERCKSIWSGHFWFH